MDEICLEMGELFDKSECAGIEREEFQGTCKPPQAYKKSVIKMIQRRKNDAHVRMLLMEGGTS